MGRHERHKAEISEYLISKAIEHEGNVISDMIDENYIKLSEKIANKIKEDYEKVEHVKTVGNEYDSIGDIRIKTNSKSIFIEIKITKSGGTLGNIRGDALTQHSIIKNAMSWSDFRDKNDHKAWVRERLDRFNYPDSVKDDQTKTSIYKKAKYLKEHINCGRRNTEKVAKEVLNSSDDDSKIKAAEIIISIIDRSKKQKKNYIDYISDKDINKDRLRRFTYLLLSGYTRKEDIEERIEIPIDKLDDDEYIVYNGYKDSMKVEKEEKNERVEILLNDNNIDIKFTEGQSGFDITIEDDVLIRGQFHWKNKFQGIETPCINLFNKN